MQTTPSLPSLLVTTVLLAVLSPVATAGEWPEASEVEQEDGSVKLIYQLGPSKYSLAEPDDIEDLDENAQVCFVVKLREIEKDEISVAETGFRDVVFVPSPLLRAPELAPGDNALLGCLRKTPRGEKPVVFTVRNMAAMPGDLVIYGERVAELEKDDDTTPEDWYLLGDWLDNAKQNSRIIDKEIFDRYIEAVRSAYARGLAADVAAVEETIASAVARRDRYERFLRKHGRNPRGEAAELLAPAYEDYVAEAHMRIRDGEAPPEALGRLAAAAHLLTGQLTVRLLDDEDAAVERFLAAQAAHPGVDAVGRELEKRGYVEFDGRWVTPKERERLRARTEAERLAQAEAAERERIRKERETARRKLLRAEGAVEARTLVETLLTTDDEADLTELAEMLDELPEDAARNAVYLAVSWKGPGRAAILLGKGLGAKSPRVRMDAVDGAVALGEEVLVSAVMDMLGSESSEEVALHAVRSLWSLPGARGPDTMIDLLERDGLPETVRDEAAGLLEKETGEDFGKDAFAWRKWWRGKRAEWKRKPVAP